MEGVLEAFIIKDKVCHLLDIERFIYTSDLSEKSRIGYS
jgi:hypothetical protein